jgi:hypothetical protein
MRSFSTLATLAVFAACGNADASPEGGTSDAALASATSDQSLPTLVVYKAATCGCCGGWIDHMRAAGFTVDARDVSTNAELMQVKIDAGVPGSMATCHTALIDGYVVEGHVPADQVKRLVTERPEAVVGIGVAGMPIGSPGMEGPGAQPYLVYAWNNQGAGRVFAEVDPR